MSIIRTIRPDKDRQKEGVIFFLRRGICGEIFFERRLTRIFKDLFQLAF